MTEPGLAAYQVRQAVSNLLAAVTEPGQRVVVAVSGGADSLALAAAMNSLAAELSLFCTVVIVDHGLQPASADWSAFAARAARDLGAQAVCLAWRGPYP